MSIFGVLNRTNHNNKGSIPYDHGLGLYPGHKVIQTPYQAVARIKKATRFNFNVSEGRLVLIELENHPYPPGADETITDDSRLNPLKLAEYSSLSYSGLPDKITVSGTEQFNGEHNIAALDGAEGRKNGKKFLIYDTFNDPNTTTSNYTEEDAGSLYLAPLSRGRIMLNPMRVMRHPSFAQREGEGIYTYAYEPSITRNFIFAPATKIDANIQRTISSSTLIVQPQVKEDVVITETWFGGNRNLSTLSEMFRVFHNYWVTTPAAGKALTWEPRDRTGDRFKVHIVQVQLGGLDYEYQEVRQYVDRSKGSYLDAQLTLKFKLANISRPSKPTITIEGR